MSLPAFASGCASLGSSLLGTTVKTGGEYSSRSLGLSMRLPAGWYMDDCNSASVFATKAGYNLNMIHVAKNGPDEPLPLTGRRGFEGMLSVDMASAMLAEERHRDELSAFSLVSNSPCAIAGRSGCRLEYTCRLGGIAYRSLSYGFINDGKLYRIQFMAPERFYFAESAAEFERTAASVHLR